MSDRRNKLRSLLARIIHWFAQVWRRSCAEGDTLDVIDRGQERCSADVEPEIGALPQEPPSQPLWEILAAGRYPPIAVVDLGQDLSKAMRASWNDGRPFESGGVIDSTWLQPLFAAGSTAGASAFAGNIFLATADPKTLMVIRRRVSTAVMDGGRIIGHAPFIAARSAILPVVAPLMLFTTVSSLIIGARLDRVQSALGALSEILVRVRQVIEAGVHGKFQSATMQLDEISSQFEHSLRFTDAMKTELALARRDINQLNYQFGHLTSLKIGSENDARKATSDINLFFLSSLMDIRADMLRLYLTLQDDPGYVGRRHAALAKKVEQYNSTFKTLLDQDPIARFCKERESSKVPFYEIRMRLRERLGGEPPARIRSVEKIRDDFRPIREQIERWIDAFDSATDTAYEESIVVYRDLDGERALHVHHTRDLRLRPRKELDRLSGGGDAGGQRASE